MKLIFVLSLCIILLINCDQGNPVQSQNNDPEIISLEAFPNLVNPLDSFIVICNAIDPDGDTLVYDWITGGRLKIKGTNDFDSYHNKKNTQIFYTPDTVYHYVDTLGIWCDVRDVKGGGDSKFILIFLSK